MTGRGMGYCGCNNRGRFYNPAPGFRDVYELGYRGMARGWRNRFYATGVPGWVPPIPEQEIAELTAWADQLKTQLDAIQKRIEELKT
jgi:hypothetical protein